MPGKRPSTPVSGAASTVTACTKRIARQIPAALPATQRRLRRCTSTNARSRPVTRAARSATRRIASVRPRYARVRPATPISRCSRPTSTRAHLAIHLTTTRREPVRAAIKRTCSTPKATASAVIHRTPTRWRPARRPWRARLATRPSTTPINHAPRVTRLMPASRALRRATASAATPIADARRRPRVMPTAVVATRRMDRCLSPARRCARLAILRRSRQRAAPVTPTARHVTPRRSTIRKRLHLRARRVTRAKPVVFQPATLRARAVMLPTIRAPPSRPARAATSKQRFRDCTRLHSTATARAVTALTKHAAGTTGQPAFSVIAIVRSTSRPHGHARGAIRSPVNSASSSRRLAQMLRRGAGPCRPCAFPLPEPATEMASRLLNPCV
jgi:hypothetical protein